ncbi:hypothetical protein TIFTF001_020098 [Ficus carica]|uniref:DUF4220 domain-containing protein n=1 Tax=Ficus carica TaxID=3494 RepID=A0AA88ACZ4_FICCA|nr:hypothetical protein TIFTF001_020098 [Ficus carica]
MHPKKIAGKASRRINYISLDNAKSAFSLEDNALWLRHFLGLIFQVIAVGYVFVQSLPSNKLWVPTSLLLDAGVIKYAERTRALYLTSFDGFRKSLQTEADPGEDYATWMEDYDAKKGAAPTPHIIQVPGAPIFWKLHGEEGDVLDDISVVEHAHRFFEIFRGVLADLIFSKSEQFDSKYFFSKKSSGDALRIISVELNFMYQVLYTKVVVVRSKLGYILRFISFSAVVVALLMFSSLEKSKSFNNNVDVVITYILLYGAIFLDGIAFFTLVFSDWTVATPMVQGKLGSFMAILLGKYLKLRRPNWSITNTGHQQSSNFLDWGRRLLFRRWSESVSCFNLIDYCLKETPKLNHKFLDYPGVIYIEVIDFFGLKDFRDQLKYVSIKPLSKELWYFIFKRVFEYPDDAGTGAFTLQTIERNNYCQRLWHSVTGVDYDQSLLLWHVATELCYNSDDDHGVGNVVDQERREYSKLLSDYMLYLLVMQPAVMSSIAGIAQKRFQDTCAEAKRFFSQRESGGGVKQEEAKRRILQVSTDFNSVEVRGDKCKSVLFEGSILAKELEDQFGEKKWEVRSEVWVELLAYAAGRCGPKSHAQVLSRGGELLSHVWLLMVHFGKVGQFQRRSGDRITFH